MREMEKSRRTGEGLSYKKLKELETSSAVEKSLREGLEVPTTATQFERDFRSLAGRQAEK